MWSLHFGLRLRLLAWCRLAHASKAEQQAREEDQLFGEGQDEGLPFSEEASGSAAEKARSHAADKREARAAAAKEEFRVAKGLIKGTKVRLKRKASVTAAKGLSQEETLQVGTSGVVVASWSGVPGEKVAIAGDAQGQGWLQAVQGPVGGSWLVDALCLELEPVEGHEGTVFTAVEDSDGEEAAEAAAVFHWPRPVSVEGLGEVDETLGHLPAHRRVRVQDVVRDAGSDGETVMLLVEDIEEGIEFESDEQFDPGCLAFDRCREPYHYDKGSEDPEDYEEPSGTAGGAGGSVVEMQVFKQNRYIKVWRKAVWVEAVDFHPEPL